MSDETNKWSADLEKVTSWRQTFKQLIEKTPTSDADVAWRQQMLANIEDSESIDMELQDAGVPFSVGELTNLQTPYPEAIPILLKHLNRKHRPDVEESIIRALGVSYGGNEVFTALLEYLSAHRSALKTTTLFVLGNSLALTSTKQHFRQLADVVYDHGNGDARLQPLLKLAKEKSPAVAETAKRWLDSDETAWYALRALRLAKVWSASKSADRYRSSADGEIRAEALKYLKAAAKVKTQGG